MKEAHGSHEVSLDNFVRSELPRLYRVAVRMTGSRDLADDLVGTSLMHAAKAWNTFDGRFPIAWIHRIMLNVYLRQNQRDQHYKAVSLDAISDEPSGENVHTVVSEKLESRAILASLDLISADHKAIIILCDIEDLNYDEVAQILEISRGTVASRLHRARKALVMVHGLKTC